MRGGRAEIISAATGKTDNCINGASSLLFSIFCYMRPDDTSNHLTGWNDLVFKHLQSGLFAV